LQNRTLIEAIMGNDTEAKKKWSEEKKKKDILDETGK
jgi:hypothetical protein